LPFVSFSVLTCGYSMPVHVTSLHVTVVSA
jgi:hypothetical protein